MTHHTTSRTELTRTGTEVPSIGVPRPIALTAALGVATAGLGVGQALLLARVIAGAVTDGDTLAGLTAPLAGLVAVVLGRAAVSGAQEPRA